VLFINYLHYYEVKILRAYFDDLQLVWRGIDANLVGFCSAI